MLFWNRSSKSSTFLDLPSKSEAVSAFGIGSRLVDGNVDIEGRSLICSLERRCCFGHFAD